jgi:hypothetical protein
MPKCKEFSSRELRCGFPLPSDDYLTDTHQLVFTKTRILSVKVATLVTFLSMVKTLDQVNKEIFPRSRLG